jgi:hypothetical protein
VKHFVNKDSTINWKNGIIGSMMIVTIMIIVKRMMIIVRTIVAIKTMLIVLDNDKTDNNDLSNN